MFQMGNSVFCWFWKRIIVTAQLAFGIILFEILIISIVNIAMMFKKNKTSTMKPFKNAHSAVSVAGYETAHKV